jgi:phenylacetic acid degradation operon negative regulatory protein
VTVVSDELPAQRGGAKALLLTILGEYVLPAGGAAWTSSLVVAAGALGVGEKNARQAVARIGDQGLIESERHGRSVRWSLTSAGRELLESGTRRIYGFGAGTVEWQGEWLLAHCPVAESARTVRNQLRTDLGFLGFGELSATLLVSPHVEREHELRQVLRSLGLSDDCTVLRSTTSSHDDDVELASRAWNLTELSDAYVAFSTAQRGRDPATPEDSFRSIVELVHDWRRFPFIDPELPTELLPDPWAGTAAFDVFHGCHDAWSSEAQRWFGELESSERQAS